MIRLALAFALSIISSAASGDTAQDAQELRRTFVSSVVYIPSADGPRRIEMASLPRYLSQNKHVQVVLYAHGCAGISRVDHSAGRFHAGLGYVFVAPNAFARKVKPLSCRPFLRKGGLHRRVLAWRHAEIDFALSRLRALPGLEKAPVALVGHSEGGITIATIRTGPVAVRVIEGWTCHGYWPEYKGLNAPQREAVLSLVGDGDPWFQTANLRGDCGTFMDGNDQSVVFRYPDPLYNNHWLTSNKRAREIVASFLSKNM